MLNDYRSNSKHRTLITGTLSDWAYLNAGVPQGSVLGPLLFIIYMNDIANASKLFDFILYADDTSLTTTIELVIRDGNIRTLEVGINSELDKINEWLKLNKLSLNVSKTKYMIFHMHNKVIPQIEVKIEDTVIEQVSEFSFVPNIIKSLFGKICCLCRMQ